MGKPTASNVQIRKARLTDLEVLVRYRRLMWEDLGVEDRRALDEQDRVYKRWARTRLKNKTLIGWLAVTRDGKVTAIGCLWLQSMLPKPGNNRMLQPYMFSMYTIPSFRGKGIASRILREAVRWGKRNHFLSLGLHASEIGRRVYSRVGFKRTWEMRIRFGPEAKLKANRPLLHSRKR
jgi:GNAT superfamily N-acetyltransferase